MGAFGEPKLESFKGRFFLNYLGSFLRISWRHDESLDISLFIPSHRSFLINVILDLWLGLRDSVASPIVTPSWTDRVVIENLIENSSSRSSDRELPLLLLLQIENLIESCLLLSH